MDSALDSVEVLWRGTNQQNTGDTLKLYDDGKFGDIIANDNIFSRRIPNSNTILANVIPASAKDSVFLSIRSIYKNRIVESELNPFILGNIHPKIGAIVIPSSVDRPSSNADPNIVNTIKFSVTASVSDANGLDDIKRVFFRSYHVGLDSVMNNGNPILLLDDGSGSSGSGDLQKGDMAVVKSFLGELATESRFMEMGILPGVELRLVKFAPLGGTIELKVRNYYVSIRHQDALNIIIEN